MRHFQIGAVYYVPEVPPAFVIITGETFMDLDIIVNETNGELRWPRKFKSQFAVLRKVDGKYTLVENGPLPVKRFYPQDHPQSMKKITQQQRQLFFAAMKEAHESRLEAMSRAAHIESLVGFTIAPVQAPHFPTRGRA